MEIKRLEKILPITVFCVAFSISINAQTPVNDDGVVLDYDYALFGAGMQKNDDYGVSYAGVGMQLSKRVDNIVVSLAPSVAGIDADDVDLDGTVVQFDASFGYITEISDKLHLVPSLGLHFEAFDADVAGIGVNGSSYDFVPSITLNYAALERLQLQASLMGAINLADSFDDKFRPEVRDGLGIGFGARYGITKNIGVNINADFISKIQVYVIGLSYHY